MKKSFKLFVLLLSFFVYNAYSSTINDSQIIRTDSRVYTLFHELEMNSQKWSFTESTPISVGELKFYLRKYDYEKLSPVSQKIYKEIEGILYEEKNFFPIDDVQIDANLVANPEVYFKTNDAIPFSFNYYYKDNLLTIPINIGFGNRFSMGEDFFIGKNYHASKKNDNYCNLPIDFELKSIVKGSEFNLPTFAYGSLADTYENWGYNLQIGKLGKTIGETLSGSLIYNKTFETDAFVDFDVYSDFFKYTLSVVQISSNRMDQFQQENTDRFMYLHQFDMRFFEKFKFTFLEGSMTSGPFSIRYFNPLPIMHQFGGWTDYVTDENKKIYIETNFCAYMSMILDYVPVENWRLYCLYNQVELQQVWERKNDWGGRYYPTSIGLQLGSEYYLDLKNDSKLKFGLEGVYTSPYLYIKQTPSSSLYRFRKDMQTKQKIYSWIGTPFGPDCVAGQFRTQYIPNKKWNTEFDYVFSAKGNNDFDIFDTTEMEDGKLYYTYYPSVIWRLWKYRKNKAAQNNDTLNQDKEIDEEELFKETMRLFPNGAPVFKNEIAFSGNYRINDHFEISGQTLFTYIINNNHQLNENQFGAQFSLALTYNLF